ncbi:receptor activity-modifying protein 1 isoform X2 [Xiphias gladius]|uniref:receptor activity-modifying protein 1 isoform X2 n=1 Tax=Xiphias gladius TaxID=8245 RepID=UPI001A98877B|nr:receptor activity-modifying protein 1 isoform X2 [Xiphias gladius]
MGSQTGAAPHRQTLLWFIVASQCVLALGCGPHYEYAIEEFCLARFRLDMQELDQRHWCSWEDTVELDVCCDGVNQSGRFYESIEINSCPEGSTVT